MSYTGEPTRRGGRLGWEPGDRRTRADDGYGRSRSRSSSRSEPSVAEPCEYGEHITQFHHRQNSPDGVPRVWIPQQGGRQPSPDPRHAVHQRLGAQQATTGPWVSDVLQTVGPSGTETAASDLEGLGLQAPTTGYPKDQRPVGQVPQFPAAMIRPSTGRPPAERVPNPLLTAATNWMYVKPGMTKEDLQELTNRKLFRWIVGRRPLRGPGSK